MSSLSSLSSSRPITPTEASASSTPDPVQRSKKGKQGKYDTWAQAEQRLFVQLWAANHEWLESRESRTAWRKICDDLNARMKSNKTVEKYMKKIKYLIERCKEAKEWNRKQTEGSKKKSLFYDEIAAVLGCRDIVTLTNVSILSRENVLFFQM